MDTSDLDFRPVYEEGRFIDVRRLPNADAWNKHKYFIQLFKVIDRLITKIFKVSYLKMDNRCKIGRSLDTGARLYLKFIKQKIYQILLTRPVKISWS